MLKIRPGLQGKRGSVTASVKSPPASFKTGEAPAPGKSYPQLPGTLGACCSNSIRLGLQGTIGKQNIEAAKAILQAYQVSVQKEDLGGDKGRKILFYSAIGKVLVKEISSSFPQDKRSLYCG